MEEDKLIEGVFNLVKDFEGDATSLLEAASRKVEIYQREIQEGIRKKNKDRIKEVADEIFKLCPVCNFIPVAVETESEMDFTTEVDFDRIWEVCCDYICDEEDNDYGLVMPYQTDDMTFGDWKKVDKLWKELINLAGYKYSLTHDGDYCEFYHVNVIGYSKKKKKIEEHYDINR